MTLGQTSRRLLAPGTVPMRSARPPSPEATTDLALRFAVCAVLIFGPLAFGAVEEWARFALECAASAVFLLWAIRQALAVQPRIRWTPAYVPALALALLVAVQLVSGRTAYWYETWAHALIALAYALVAFVALQVFRRREDLRVLLTVLGSFGFALALFAILQDLTWNGQVYWLRQVPLDVSPYGPYVNHNHFAGLMEMLVPIPVVLAFARNLKSGQRIIAGFAAITMGASIVLSRSRGGILALLAEMIFLSVCVALIRPSKGIAVSIASLLVGIVAMAVFVGIDPLLLRLASTRSHLDAELHRWSMVKDSWPLWAQRPIFGWGLGTFPAVYPHFRSFYTNHFVNQAHNDYLQVLVELGLAGFACVVALLFLVYREGLRKMKADATGAWLTFGEGAAALAMLTGITGILVHSLLDYNLQVPANAMLFYVLCALVSAPSHDPQAAFAARPQGIGRNRIPPRKYGREPSRNRRSCHGEVTQQGLDAADTADQQLQEQRREAAQRMRNRKNAIQSVVSCHFLLRPTSTAARRILRG